MICRHDRLNRFAIAVMALLLLGSRGEQRPEPAPLDRARAALARGDALGAEIILERMVEQGTPRADVAAFLGEAELAEGDIAQARNWLEPGDFSPATRLHGFRMLAKLEMGEGMLAAAGKALDAALRVSPDDPELWVDIGRLRYRGGEQIQAIAAAERAMTLGPNNAAALLFRGQILRDAQGSQPAAQWFGRALALHPGNVELRAEYAATLGDAGRAREALAVLRAGAVQQTVPSRYLFIQAVLAARGGERALAQSLLQRSGEEQRGVPAALMLSALIDCDDGNFASAAQTLDRLANRQPDNARVQNLLAYALSRSGGERELVGRFAALAAGNDGSPYLRTLVGRAYEVLDDRVAAARFLDQAAAPGQEITVLPPGPQGSGNGSDDLASRNAVRRSINDGQSALARAQAALLVRRLPGSGDARALLGDALLAMENRDEARKAYEFSARVRRPWPLVLRMIAADAGDDGARRLLESYLRANPMNAEAAALLADAYAAKGDWARSARLLDHAIANGQGRGPVILAARSLVAARTRDVDRALELALRAHALQPLNQAAITALIAALPAGEQEARAELEQKLRSLAKR